MKNEDLIGNSNAIRNHVRPQRAPWWMRAGALFMALSGLLLLAAWIKGIIER